MKLFEFITNILKTIFAKGKYCPNKLKSYKLQAKLGSSLIELMVSISIFAIITGVILANHSRFSGNILIKNLAYDIALSIRKAQVFGVSVKEFAPTGFETRYGIHFDDGSNDSYIFFADINENNLYDGRNDNETGNDGKTEEAIDIFTIKRSTVISDFCGIISGPPGECRGTGEIKRLDIIFNRPNPDAIINSDILSNYASAEITILSSQGVEYVITVVATGQISVKQK